MDEAGCSSGPACRSLCLRALCRWAEDGNLTDSPRILFAGGCHVNGFPVGAEHSLSSVALRWLGHPEAEKPIAFAYITLKSGRLLTEACREQQAEFLVLQVGNYETMPRFGKILGIRGSSGSSSISSYSVPFAPDPKMQYKPTVRSRLLDARRMALAALLTAMGKKRKIFDEAAMAARLDSVLKGLRDLPLKGIVLLSPFSCPDRLTRACRRRAAPIFAAAAKKFGCIFVDAFNELEGYPRGEAYRANFADECHLGRLGHERVGRMVGEALRAAMEAARS